MNVIGKFACMKERRVKQNSQVWFDEEIADEIKNRDRLFKNLKIQNHTLTKIFIMRQDIKYRK